MCLLSQVLRFFFSGASVTHNSRTSPISPAAFKKKGIFHVKKEKPPKWLEKTAFILFLCITRSRNGVFPFLERAFTSALLKL